MTEYEQVDEQVAQASCLVWLVCPTWDMNPNYSKSQERTHISASSERLFKLCRNINTVLIWKCTF